MKHWWAYITVGRGSYCDQKEIGSVKWNNFTLCYHRLFYTPLKVDITWSDSVTTLSFWIIFQLSQCFTMSLQRNTNLVHSRAPTAYTIMFILPRECKKQSITRTVLLSMLYGTVKYNVNNRWVTYRKTLTMNIHNGGSEFILLSMTFGIVQHNVNHHWVTYRKTTYLGQLRVNKCNSEIPR